jgi:hypothetical protein
MKKFGFYFPSRLVALVSIYLFKKITAYSSKRSQIVNPMSMIPQTSAAAATAGARGPDPIAVPHAAIPTLFTLCRTAMPATVERVAFATFLFSFFVIHITSILLFIKRSTDCKCSVVGLSATPGFTITRKVGKLCR